MFNHDTNILLKIQIKVSKIYVFILPLRIVILTVSGMYLSGMTILSGTPKRLSMVVSLIFEPSLLWSNADFMTSGVHRPSVFRACSMSKSSHARPCSSCNK